MARLTAGERDAFLQALSLGHTPKKAAELIGRGRRTMYDHRAKDAEFLAAWDEAVEDGKELLEQEAFRRAFEGVERKVYYQGEEIAVERTYSDTLLIQLLRTRSPQRWGNKLKIDAALEVDYAAEIFAARKRAGIDALPAAAPLPPREITLPAQELADARERAGLDATQPTPLAPGEYVPIGAVADALGDSWALALRVPVGVATQPVLRFTPAAGGYEAFDVIADLVTHGHALLAGGEGCNAMAIAHEILTPEVLARVAMMVRHETGGRNEA